MSGVVHFKFKSAISFDSVQFDGAFVTVGELKNLIAEKKGLGREATGELILSDPRSHAEYTDDAHLLPKSTSVLVRRAPVSKLRALEGSTEEGGVTSTSAAAPASDRPSGTQRPQQPSQQPFPAFRTAPQDDFGGDLYAQQQQPSSSAAGPGSTEEDAIASRLAQTGASWQKEVAAGGRGRGRGRGRGGRGGIAIPPPNYICFRCNQGGHYIGDCPTNGDPEYDRKRIRQPVGIPLSRLAINQEGGLVLPGGHTGSLVPNEDVFQREMFGTSLKAKAEQQKVADEPKPALPQPSSSQPVASAPLMLDNKPDTQDAPGQEVVVYNAPEAAPALAGDDQLFLALAQPLVPPKPKTSPVRGTEKAASAKGPAAPGNPWLPPLPMPLMPPAVAAPPPFMAAFAPDMAAPLSKEAFEALRVAALRDQRAGSSGSSRSRSRSPRRPRRRSREATPEREGGGRRRRHGDRNARRSRFGEKRRADASESPARSEERGGHRHERESRSKRDAEPPRSNDHHHSKRRRAAPERRTQDAAPSEEAPPDERFGAAMDRWEPGSDFESKTVARSKRSKRAEGAADSAAQTSAAQPLLQASNGPKFVTASAAADQAGAEVAVSGPAATEGLADRDHPEQQQQQQQTLEPIALLEELDEAPQMDFSSKAILGQGVQSEELKEKGRDKEKKDKKHKKHKKHHKKEKKHHKKDRLDANDKDQSEGSPEAEGAKEASQVQTEAVRATAAPPALVPNPRLFQLSHSAATASARGGHQQTDRRHRTC